MPLTTSPFFASALTRNALTFIAWSWLVSDYALRFRKERETIWKPLLGESRLAYVPGLYIFIRYSGCIGQTVNLIWTTVLLSSPFIPPAMCSRWFWFQSAIIQCLFCAVDYIIMLRVATLFYKDWRGRIGHFFLFVLWLFARIVLMYTAIETSRALQHDKTCLMARPRFGLMVGLIVTIVSAHSLTGGMTLVLLRHHRRSPLTRQVKRDSVLSLALIVALYGVVLYANFVDVLLHNIHAFMITILSNVGCAAILNLRTLSDDEATEPSHTNASTWCLDTLESSFAAGDDYEASIVANPTSKAPQSI